MGIFKIVYIDPKKQEWVETIAEYDCLDSARDHAYLLADKRSHFLYMWHSKSTGASPGYWVAQ